MKKYLYIVIGTMLLASCQPDTGCRLETKVTCGVTVEWVVVDSLGHGTIRHEWDSISLKGVGRDSILYDNSHNVKVLRLPLRTDTALTDYAITWHEKKDVLHIRHCNDRHYLSMACGCIIYHTIDSVWSDGVFIDSLSILNSTVENYEQDNIYLRLKSEK